MAQADSLEETLHGRVSLAGHARGIQPLCGKNPKDDRVARPHGLLRVHPAGRQPHRRQKVAGLHLRAHHMQQRMPQSMRFGCTHYAATFGTKHGRFLVLLVLDHCMAPWHSYDHFTVPTPNFGTSTGASLPPAGAAHRGAAARPRGALGRRACQHAGCQVLGACMARMLHILWLLLGRCPGTQSDECLLSQACRAWNLRADLLFKGITHVPRMVLSDALGVWAGLSHGPGPPGAVHMGPRTCSCTGICGVGPGFTQRCAEAGTGEHSESMQGATQAGFRPTGPVIYKASSLGT